MKRFVSLSGWMMVAVTAVIAKANDGPISATAAGFATVFVDKTQPRPPDGEVRRGGGIE